MQFKKLLVTVLFLLTGAMSVSAQSQPQYPFFFPKGFYQTTDPLKQREEYVRWLNSTWACNQGGGMGTTIPGSDSIRVHTDVVSTDSVTENPAKMTMVFVEQDAEALFQLADRVAVLDEGRIVLQGQPREVFAPPARLGALGLDVPQLSVAADIFRARTGRPYDFLTVDEAQAALKA